MYDCDLLHELLPKQRLLAYFLMLIAEYLTNSSAGISSQRESYKRSFTLSIMVLHFERHINGPALYMKGVGLVLVSRASPSYANRERGAGE